MDDVMQAFNKGAIWVFLLGNVLTGAINKMLEGRISTLDATVSLPILTAYLATLVVFVLVFFRKPEVGRKDADDGAPLAESLEDKKYQ